MSDRTVKLMAVGIPLLFVIIAMVIVGISTDWEFSDEPDFRRTCDRLGAEFYSGDRWMCIRDGEVVYP